MRFTVLGTAALVLLATCATLASAGEVMNDACSAEVAIVPFYDARPETPQTVILKRDANGSTAWSAPFSVQLGPNGHVRWWCHSTSGNMFDIGTWRITEVVVGTKCEMQPDGTLQNCRPDGNIKLGTSAWQGWTPERSRCGNRSTRIRARLGTNRKLEIECLGR